MPYGLYLLNIEFLGSEAALTRAMARISPGRREKAGLFRLDRDKRLCVGAGLLIERVLDLLDAQGAQRQQGYLPSGRPFLPAFPRISISISHSGTYALAACCDGLVGADVQTRVADPEKLLRLLSEEELAFCQKDPAGFTRLWTLKEAYGKYTGEGLSYPPPHIRFDGERPYMPGLLCRLYEYPPIEEHFIACCLEGEKPPLTLLAPEDVL